MQEFVDRVWHKVEVVKTIANRYCDRDSLGVIFSQNSEKLIGTYYIGCQVYREMRSGEAIRNTTQQATQLKTAHCLLY